MPYTAPTPSTVAPGDTYPATAYNIIAGDIADHESRIKTGVESYTTAQKTALTGVSTGTVIYDSILGVFQSYNGSAWVNMQGTPPSLTTAQKTALGTPTTGTMVYDSTLGLLQMWNGLAWVAVGGYVPLVAPTYALNYGANVSNTSHTISWSGVRYISIDGIFNSNLRFYKMTLRITSCSATADSASLFFRNASGDVIGQWNESAMYIRDGTLSGTTGNWGFFPSAVSPAGQMGLTDFTSANITRSMAQVEFIDPGSAVPTFTNSFDFFTTNVAAPGNIWHRRRQAVELQSAAYSGITFFCGSGNTWSGSVTFHGMA